MYKTRRLSLISLFVLLTAGVAGQKNISSPFARYGIGNLEEQGPFRTLAMGGVSSGIRDNLTLNYLTPASYSSIDTASFIFDFGIDYAVIGLKDKDLKYSSQDISFAHLMLGFPIMKGLGFAAAVLPYSDGFYNIAEVSSPDIPGDVVAGNVYEYHKGTGGYQKALAGIAYSPFSYFSAGMNAFIVFGEINRINDFIFTTDNNYFNTRTQGTTAMRGIGYEASAQLMIPLPEKRFINAGMTFTPSFSLSTSNDDLVMRYSNVQTSSLAIDTLFLSSTDTTSRLPYIIRGGISFGRTDKLTIGADIVYAAWSKASLPGNYGTYADAIELHAGAEYIPDKYSNYSYFDRMEYRIGCRYSESYAIYGDSQVKEYGITFGAGIPLRRSRSRVSLYMDLSTRGNPDGNLFRETRLSVGASLNLFDYWFLKAKYD
jgi:hypothetical protein